MKKLLLVFVLLLIAIPIALIVLLLDTQPGVAGRTPLDGRDMQSIRQLVAELKEPHPDQSLVLGEQELSHFVQYGLDRAQLPSPINGQVILSARQGGTLLLGSDAGTPVLRYININVQFGTDGNDVKVRGVRIGKLAIPPQWAYRAAIAIVPPGDIEKLLEQWQALRKTIEYIAINDGAAVVQFSDSPNLKQQIQQQQIALLVGDKVMQLLPLYQDQLRRKFLGYSGKKLSLADALQTSFQFANSRIEQGFDASHENSAATLALALNTASDEVLELLGLPTTEMAGESFILTLQNRFDLAQHFLSAAVLAIYTDAEIASLAGVVKEMEDLHSRTGFSLSDLIADTAGVNFAKAAIDPDTAAEFARRLADDYDESYFFPGRQTTRQSASESLMASANDGDEQAIMIDLKNNIDHLIHQLPIYQDL